MILRFSSVVLVAAGAIACQSDDSEETSNAARSPSVTNDMAEPTPPSGATNATPSGNAQPQAPSDAGAPVSTSAGSDAGSSDAASPADASAPSGPCFHARDLAMGHAGPIAVSNRGEVIANNASEALYFDGQKTVTLPGFGGATAALAMNDHGEIVGQSQPADNSAPHAIYWKDGVATDLGTFGGGRLSIAYAIANNGDIAGLAYDAAGNEHAVLWRKGVITDLGVAGRAESLAEFVNEHGQVLGDSILSHNGTRGAAISHALLWSGGATTDLVPPDTQDDTFWAEGLNASGQAVITSGQAGDHERHAWLWKAGTFTNVTPFADAFALKVAGISDRGDVAGYASRGSSVLDQTGPFGFIWRDGTTTPVAPPSGDPVRVEVIDAHGQVAGEALEDQQREFRAFTWMNGKFVYLTDSTVWSAPIAMNDHGQIAVVLGLPSTSVQLFDTAGCFDDYSTPPSSGPTSP